MSEHTEQERGTVSTQSTVIHSRPARASLRWWAVLGLVVAAVVFGFYGIAQQPSRQLRSAEALLAQAYSKQRGFDLRLPDASYAPIESQLEKGETSAFSRPIALLEAESRIAVRLAKNPDDAQWLRLRARAEMLDRHYDDAVSTLQRATDAQPEDVSLLADLGCAYALRAEGERRDIDFGAAIDMLWRFLRANPDSPVALFNRAVVYERMFLYDDARKDWEHYLKLDPSSGWAQEARGRKQAIEGKMAARERAMKSLASASGYLESVKSGRAYDPEFYLEAAVTSWLPAAATDATAGEAVAMLARLLREKHEDSWMADLLKAKHDVRYRDATAHLAAALTQNLAEEPEGALEEARQARRIYREAGIRSGELRAKYEEVYALYRSMEAKKCLGLASQLVGEAATHQYGWILGQALMEEGNCRTAAGDEGGGRDNFEHALAEARGKGYKTQQLRDLGLLGSNATSLGNQVAVWQQITDRLATYWQAPYRGNRGHQFYHDLSKASASLGYKFSAFVFRRAAAEEISKTASQVLEAYARAVLASLADAADLTTEADQEFSKASELFGRCRQTESLQLQRFASQVRRAESQVKTNPELALMQLRKILSTGDSFATLDTELMFYQAEGRAKLMLRDLEGADSAFRRAIRCNEQMLASLSAGMDRGGPLRKSEDAYRGIVHVSSDRNPEDALKLWEWYRAADLAGSRRELNPDVRLPRLDSETVLSYALSPAGALGVWVLGDGKVEWWRLSVRREQLEPVVNRFLRQCADPKSSVSALHRDARQLYDWLLAPIAHRLQPDRVLVLEPDGPIGAIPLQALASPAGNYLGEQFSIVVSRGLTEYQERSHRNPLTSQSTALVMANPELGSDLAKAFPPLIDAAREAQELAALFTRARLLSGKESTMEALESARGGVEIFHFAGHSISADGDAGLLLSPSGESDMGGRLLKASRLLGQDWSHCSLAVLSACSTGTGERNGFVNPESLVRAFLNAGAGRVIASRWNVDTAATAGFMRRFYQSVLSGALPSLALREAAEALRKDPTTAHPYYWAAFQLFGYK
jgi:CHAT domain-containing protein/Flp pilus assembly protein TadD